MSELAVTIGIIWALFFSCVTVAIALAIAWWQFDHPRYALSWAFAFAVNAGQIAVAFAGELAGPNAVLTGLAFALMMVPSPLFAIGVRQRAGLDDRRLIYVTIALLLLAFRAAGTRMGGLAVFADPAAMLYSALVLLDAALTLRPSPFRSAVAEWTLVGTMLLLANIELAVTILTCLHEFSIGNAVVAIVYHGLLVAVEPPCVIASGVAAVLLVASDLALQLRRIAACDPLTGLYNRRGFQDLAVQALARSRNSRQPVSLAVGDIDHFKRINDDHGHAIGDQTLVLVGHRLSAGARADDLVGRIGGEEFAVLMLDSRGYEAAQTMDLIRQDISQGLTAGDTVLSVTVSFGIAEVGTDGSIQAMLSDALDRADRALYRSKVGGRDRVTLAGPSDPDAEPADRGLATA